MIAAAPPPPLEHPKTVQASEGLTAIGGLGERVASLARRRHRPFHGPVIASWFDDSGSTACGTHYKYGFATLIGIPCGGSITMRGPNGRLVRATREDSGPYVAGRTFDLNPGLRDALGCGGLCRVWWRR